MTTYGLLTTGFLPKPQDVARQEITALVQAKRGLSTDCSDGSLIGVFVGILSEREATLWDLGQAINSSQDPDMATGSQEDAVCALTGTFRQNAKSSTVTLTLTGTPSTVVPSQSQVKTLSTNALFKTASSATIVVLTAWTITTAYLVNDRRTNAGFTYVCITAGTSAGAGGPNTRNPNITDGTVHWRYMGDGTGAVDVPAQSITQDAIVAVSGDLTVINTPVGGWSSAINLLDASLGAPLQSDALLRLSREAELSQEGSGTPDSLRGDILNIEGVTSCTVFHNDTDFIDVNGLPPHSVQALVEGGDGTEIATTLLANVAAGIITFGTTTIPLVDSMGNTQNISFTRTTQVNMWADVTLLYNPTTAAAGGYPAGGDQLVQLNVAEFGDALAAGRDVVAASINSAIFPLFSSGVLLVGVQGVLDATTLVYNDVIGTAAAWLPTHAYVATVGVRSVVTNDGGRTYICITAGTSAGSGGPIGTATDITDGTVHWRFLGATFNITPFQRPNFDTTRVTVHSSPGTP